jgi:hypothetical protein
VYENHGDSGRTLNTLSIEKGATLTNTYRQKGIRERMLCDRCEGRFAVWEKYAAERLHSALPTLLKKATDIDCDPTVLRKYVLSLLWRCSICDYPHYKLDIGPHSETIRSILLDEQDDFNGYLPILMVSIVSDEYEVMKDLIFVHSGPRVEKYRTARINLAGVLFTIFIGSVVHRPPPIVQMGTICRDKKPRVWPARISDIEFMMKSAAVVFDKR